MLEEPIPATRTVLKKAGMTHDDIDLYEDSEPLPAGAGSIGFGM
jgi:acetyl-CoA acetyltransferase